VTAKTALTDVAVGDLFEGQNGKAVFIKDYLHKHPGPHPVYSASLEEPFGHVDTFDYEGNMLTWVLNGYGGRVQEVSGKFSASRDRGVLVPRNGVEVPDLTYLRYAIEPVFVASAVGRRVDGRKNDYTKLYPKEAMAQRIPMPLDASGHHDYARMKAIGARLRRIEAAQAAVRKSLESVLAARVTIDSLLTSEDEAS
jgi:hypothetical protein